MIKPPKELVDAFFVWLENDPHSEWEDFYKDQVTEKNLSSMKKAEFVDFFVQFFAVGGKVQSGGERNKNLFRKEISEKYSDFRKFVLEPFDKEFDHLSWLTNAKQIKYFGRGICTIYLNRVDKNRFSIVNNKTKDALELFDVKVPTAPGKAHEIVNEAQKQLINWYPQFDNFFRADAFNHYLIGVKEGRAMAKKLLSGDKSNDDDLAKLILRLREENCLPERIQYRKLKEKEAKDILTGKPIDKLTAKDWELFFRLSNMDFWKGNETETRFGLGLKGHNRTKMLENIGMVNKCAAELMACTEKEIDRVLDDWWTDPIPGMGTSFPTLILYLRLPKKYNIWLPTVAKNIASLTQETPLLKASAKNYRQFNKNVQTFRQTYGLEAQETDIILSLKEAPIGSDPKPTDKILRENLPLNLILYGPPGTGKTYTLRNEYFDRFTAKGQIKTKEKFAEEIALDSAWWEIVTMVLLDLKKATVPEIMQHSLLNAKERVTTSKSRRATVWSMLQIHTKLDCPNVGYKKRAEPLIFSKDEDSVWSVDVEIVKAELGELYAKLDDFKSFVEEEADEKLYEFITFHQSYSYEEFVEGIKPVIEEEGGGEVGLGQVLYEIKPGVFKKLVDRALKNPDKRYALFIDEISRGNVASIFGELITLIEDDKRKDAVNEIIAKLPYSREQFVVPQNLHIIGTMNTADRSVVALDNALRRRFSFKEIVSKPEKILQPEKLNVDLQSMLRKINSRIERLLDRDHHIGHSYFMNLENSESPLSDLQNIFAIKILPLLQEYFYGDPAKIGMVLGGKFVESTDDSISFAQGDWEEDIYEERKVYKFIDPMNINEDGFKSIYE